MGAVNLTENQIWGTIKILHQHTDEDRATINEPTLSHTRVGRLTCDRHRLAKDIVILSANGFEVVHRSTQYVMLFFIVDRRFNIAEVKIIIDTMWSSYFTMFQKTKRLTLRSQL